MLTKLARALMHILRRVPVWLPGRKRKRGGLHTLEVTITIDTAPVENGLRELREALRHYRSED